MKKLIIAIVIGLSLVFVGGIAMLIGGSIVYKNHGDFNLSRYENKTYIAEEEVNDLSIDLTTFDLNIKISSDDKLKVEYFSSDKEKCDIVLENGLLKITDIDERKWFEKIFSFGNKVLTIYLPEKNITL